jgi:molybdenum cofactor guanylyltransferase
MSKLYGLVVCGGQSSRMGTDKSLLDYHGQPQRYHLYDILSSLCERVFISCNEQQAPTIPDNYSIIVDAAEYRDAGPMTALLSAFKAYPDADFLVVGCDYPYLQPAHLQSLLEAKSQHMSAAAFFNDPIRTYEPLLAVYQSITKNHLENNFKQSRRSLSRFLEEINAAKVIPNDPDIIRSVDTWQEYLEAKVRIEKA